MIFPLAELHLVERLRPGAPVPGVSGEFVNALADELGTGPTVRHDAGLATASQQGGDAGDGLYLRGALETIPILPKES